MYRECREFDFAKYWNDLHNKKNVKLYIDVKNYDEIMNWIRKTDGRDYNKMKRFIYWVYNKGHYSKYIYGKENISKKAKDVTAIKINKNNYNLRIYCKEYKNSHKKIVLVKPYHKKTQRIDTRLRNLIEKVGGYDYGL